MPHAQAESQVHRFRFTGSAGEYFRIWIVNVALTIVTLGIYSAWAKVRNKQYFYRNTWLDGASFEYLGNPIRILKGRALAAGAFILLLIAEQISIALHLILVLLLFVATPWVIVQAMRFNARNSAWRKVRFSFRGTAKGALVNYLKGIGVAIGTLGFLAPWSQWNLIRFAVENTSFGKTPFGYRTPWGPFVATFYAAGFIVSVPFVFFAIAAPFSAALAKVLIWFFLAGIVVSNAFMQMRMANLLWGGIDIGAHRLVSTQTLQGVLKLQVTNAIAIACTLGLALPWARVRKRRYLVENLSLHAAGPLVAEADPNQKDGSAAADAMADFGDFDLGFG